MLLNLGLGLGGAVAATFIDITNPTSFEITYIIDALTTLVYFAIKILVCLLLIVWTRATLPRFRYDKLMAFGWKVLLPIGLANVMVTAILIALGVPGYK